MLLFISLILKFILFYNFTHVPVSPWAVLSIDMFVVSLFYILGSTKKKGLKYLYFGIFIAVSLILFLDMTYYSYFTRMPRILEIGHAKNLGDVKSALVGLINIKNLVFLLDIPIMIYLFVKDKIFIIDDFINHKTRLKRFVYPLFCIIFSVILFIFNINSFNATKKLSLFSYHTMDILGKLEEKTVVKDIKSDVKRSADKNEFTGIAKGKNLIVIQVESLNNFPIGRKYEGQEITPNLNKLIEENGTIYHSDYYELLGAGNTSDAEFVTLHSMFPSMKNPSYEVYLNTELYGLPKIFKSEGYDVAAYHGYKRDFWIRDRAYPHIGIDKFYAEDDFNLDEKIGMGLSDGSFFNQSIEIMKKEQTEPFFSFMITLTNHVPYAMPNDLKKIKIKKEDENSIFGNYLNTVNYTDKVLGDFISKLKESGVYENSVIAIYGDHHGILMNNPDDNRRISQFVGKTYDFDTMLNIPLIIHVGGMDKNVKIDTVSSQLDFAPTILNLFGIDREKYVMMGEDILSDKNPHIVFPQSYLIRGSFINDDYIFQMKRDGIFENGELRDRKTGKVLPNESAKKFYKKAIEEIDYSKYVLENNLLMDIMKSGKKGDLKVKKSDDKLQNAVIVKNKDELNEAFKKGFRNFKVNLFETSDGFYTSVDLKGDLKDLYDDNKNLITLGDIVRGYKDNLSFILDAKDIKKLADYVRMLPGLYPNITFVLRDLESYKYVAVRQNGYKILIAGDSFSSEEKKSMYENNNELIFTNSPNLSKRSYFNDKEPKIFAFSEIKNFDIKNKDVNYKSLKTLDLKKDGVVKLLCDYDFDNKRVRFLYDNFKDEASLKESLHQSKHLFVIKSKDQAVSIMRNFKEHRLDINKILPVLNSYEEARYVYKLGFYGISFNEDYMGKASTIESTKLVDGIILK